MKVGIRLSQTGEHYARKENIFKLAKRAESVGLDSLWVLERLIWPVNPQNSYPGSRNGKFPPDWQYILDPLETLTFVAANTNRILLGTSVIDMLFHNPLILAKRFATLDVLSHGRVIAGLGLGWSKDEYQASNIPFRERGMRANEYLQILKRAWTDEIVEFRGQFYNIPQSKIGPKPVQKPHIPIYLGGYSQNTFVRIANHANGWICVIRDSLNQTRSDITKIRTEYHQLDRDSKDNQIVAILYPNVIDSDSGSSSSQSRQLLIGDINQVGNDLQEVKEIGVDHVILNYNRSSINNDIDRMIKISEQLSRFIK